MVYGGRISLAVGFAMVASYLLSSTLTPILSVWLLRGHEGAVGAAPNEGGFARFRRGYASVAERAVRARWVNVAAYAAAAAIIGRELTVPELAQTIILTRAQAASTAMPRTESLSYLAQSRATMIIHLAIRRIRQICDELMPAYGPDCPVAVVANASQPNERVLRATLATIADQVEAAGLRQAAVIMVGEALHAEDFAESHLYGKRSRLRG